MGYFFYSSDHGFQLGQFNIPMDKRHVYEWNTKIHLLARGPGIQPGSSFMHAGTQVDIAPTMLGLAGLSATEDMDGKSIVPFLVGPRDNALLASTVHHLQELGDLAVYAQDWRQEVFIKYYYCDYNVKCVNNISATCPKGDYPNKDSWCIGLNSGENNDCWCSPRGAYPTV